MGQKEIRYVIPGREANTRDYVGNIFIKSQLRRFLMRSISAYRIRLHARRVIKKVFRRRLLTTRECHVRLIREAAHDMGIEVEVLSRGFLRLRRNGQSLFCHGNDFSFESVIAYRMCGDKRITSSFLSEAGLRVPRFAAFDADHFRDAVGFFSSLDTPCVVKPAYGTSSGAGISVKVSTKPQFRRAFINALPYCPSVLVEEYVEGRHMRITLLDGELIFAVERFPAKIVGDGKHTVRQLVKQRNESISSCRGLPTAYPIEIDGETIRVLRGQGFKRGSVPRAGEIVALKKVCNATKGGETHDLTSSIDDNWVGIARRAAACLDARLAGVDLIISSDKSGAEEIYINEINTTPDLLLPSYDPQTPDAAFHYMRLLLEKIFDMPQHSKTLPSDSSSSLV